MFDIKFYSTRIKNKKYALGCSMLLMALCSMSQTMVDVGLYNKNGKAHPLTYTLTLSNTADTVTTSGRSLGDTILYDLQLPADTVFRLHYVFGNGKKTSEISESIRTYGNEALIHISLDNAKVQYNKSRVMINPYFQIYKTLADSVFIAADSLQPGNYPYLQLVNNCQVATFYPARHNNFCGDLKMLSGDTWTIISNSKTQAIFWAYKLEPGMAIKGTNLYPRHINIPLVNPGKYRFDVYLVGDYVGSLEPEWPVPIKRRKQAPQNYYLCTQQFEVRR